MTMRCIASARYFRWMPRDFDALNHKDAEYIMQVWADREAVGPLTFEWADDNGCGVFFMRRGQRLRFMTIEPSSTLGDFK